MLQKHKNNFITLFVLVAVGISSVIIVQAQTGGARERATNRADAELVKFSELKLTPYSPLFNLEELRAIFGVTSEDIGRALARSNGKELTALNVPPGTTLPLKPNFAYANGNRSTYAHSGRGNFSFAVEVGSDVKGNFISIEALNDKGQPISQGNVALLSNTKSTVRVGGVLGNNGGYTLWRLRAENPSNMSLFVLENALKVSSDEEKLSDSTLARLNTTSFNVLYEIDKDRLNTMKSARYKNLVKPKLIKFLNPSPANDSTPPDPDKAKVFNKLDEVLEEKLGDCSYLCIYDSLMEAVKRTDLSKFKKSGARNWVQEFASINGRQSYIYGGGNGAPGSPLDKFKKALWALLTEPANILTEAGRDKLETLGGNLEATFNDLTIPD